MGAVIMQEAAGQHARFAGRAERVEDRVEEEQVRALNTIVMRIINTRLADATCRAFVRCPAPRSRATVALTPMVMPMEMAVWKKLMVPANPTAAATDVSPSSDT